MMEAAKVNQDEDLHAISMPAWLCIAALVVVAISGLHYAQQYNKQEIAFGEPAHELDEESRVMLREALIKQSSSQAPPRPKSASSTAHLHTGPLALNAATARPIKSTMSDIVAQSAHAKRDRIARLEASGEPTEAMQRVTQPTSLLGVLPDIEVIQHERRQRLKARGEDVSDTRGGSGYVMLKGALEELVH